MNLAGLINAISRHFGFRIIRTRTFSGFLAAHERINPLQMQLQAESGRVGALQAQLQAESGRVEALQAQLLAERGRAEALQAQLQVSEDAVAFETSKRNYSAAGRLSESGLPDHGRRWGHYIRKMSETISECHNIHEAIRRAQDADCTGFDHRSPSSIQAPYMQLFENILVSEYPHFREQIPLFSETTASDPESLSEFNGRPVSNIMYAHAATVLSCLTHSRSINRVCEIGAGYGDVARLWFRNPIQQVSHYLILDLPESLFFAEAFLRRTLSDVPIVYILPGAEIEKYLELPQAVFLCPIALHEVTRRLPFDLIINTGSMGEMTQDWVEFWSQWLSEQDARIFYSHNYFGMPIENQFEGENLMSPLVPENWRLVSFRINHPLVMAQSLLRNGAELFFENSRAAQDTDKEAALPECLGRLRFTHRFRLSELVYFSYMFLRHRSLDAEIAFVQKIMDDFEFVPKELLFSVNRIVSHEAFASIDADRRTYIKSLQDKLQQSYQHGTKGLFY
jgi:putative sugar O-methyltransferase